NLFNDKVLWNKAIELDVDRLSINPNGRLLYVPQPDARVGRNVVPPLMRAAAESMKPYMHPRVGPARVYSRCKCEMAPSIARGTLGRAEGCFRGKHRASSRKNPWHPRRPAYGCPSQHRDTANIIDSIARAWPVDPKQRVGQASCQLLAFTLLTRGSFR